MCEITNGKIYVANRDMVCYKVMIEKGGQLGSLHHNYEYEIGREYCVDGFENKCLMDDAIYETWNMSLSPFSGWRKIYTTYPNTHKAIINLDNMSFDVLYLDGIKTDLRYTRNGFYSYTYYGNSRMESDFELISKVVSVSHGLNKIKIVRCRIPEGSKYMVSDNGDVFISERIVIDDALSL